MVKFLAHELREDKIRVAAISPGLVNTKMAAALIKTVGSKVPEGYIG